MKILHAAETIKGGVATVLKQISNSQIHSEKFEKVICIIPDSQKSELDYIGDENIVTFKRARRNLKAFFSFLTVFTQQVIRENPDYVHLHSTFAGVLGRSMLFILWPLRRPRVVYCPHAFSFLMTEKKWKRLSYIYIEKLLMLITSKVICVSNFEYEEAVRAGLDKNKLKIVHNGVPAKHDIGHREKSDVIKLLFVGRFDKQKGYDVLIEAFKMCSAKNISLTIVGDSVNEKKEKDIVDGINYTGWVAAKDIEQYFLDADVLVIPSRWEGFAMVPLEAMSYSLPIIASNATSLPEVVEDKKTGFLFSNGDAKSLAKILSEIQHYDLNQMGKRGNELFLKSFTSEIMIKKTNDLYSMP